MERGISQGPLGSNGGVAGLLTWFAAPFAAIDGVEVKVPTKPPTGGDKAGYWGAAAESPVAATSCRPIALKMLV